jgi:hypothetical protein
MQLLSSAGIAGIPLIVLSLVVGILVIRAVYCGVRGQATDLFPLLFWGFTAAVLGFLAQCAGIYNALTVIAGASEISPQVMAQGFAQSFVTTLWGGGLLLLAGLVWAISRTIVWTTRARHASLKGRP